MTEPTYERPSRRPIQSRNTRWAESATQWLVNLGVKPNAISIFGMVSAVTAGVSFYLTNNATGSGARMLWFCGGVLCQIRLLCNLFDGMVAVKQNIASPRGELYNEVPDRVSDAAVFVGLGYSATGDVPFGYIAALVSIFVAYVRAIAKSTGAPDDFCGPMAKPQRMALAMIVALYMAFSPNSWRLMWGEAKVILAIVIVGGMLTALRRLIRAARYLEGIRK